MIHPEKRKQAQPEDLAKAALVTVTNTVASIANMCAAAAVSPTHIACHTCTTAATLYTDAAPHTTASSTLPCCYSHCAISPSFLSFTRLPLPHHHHPSPPFLHTTPFPSFTPPLSPPSHHPFPPFLHTTPFPSFTPPLPSSLPSCANRRWSEWSLLATTSVTTRCPCRCFPIRWSTGPEGPFELSLWNTRATLGRWAHCSFTSECTEHNECVTQSAGNICTHKQCHI